MKTIKLVVAMGFLTAYGTAAVPQTASSPRPNVESAGYKQVAALDANAEKQALRIFLNSVRKQIVAAAEAMPAVKYQFMPTEGEFKGVRTFAMEVRHLSATNNILAGAALGEDTDDIDEKGPENVRTKPEILEYLNSSFDHLSKAIDAIGEPNPSAKASPISPLPPEKTTRLALIVEALIHAFDHYGQMVEYLRMNGIVPPASRP